MPRKRRSFTAKFRLQTALEAVKEEKTLNALASEHGVWSGQWGQLQMIRQRGLEL